MSCGLPTEEASGGPMMHFDFAPEGHGGVMRTLHTSPTSSEGLPTNIQPRIQPNRPACHGRQPLHPNLCAEFASLHQTVSCTYELNPRSVIRRTAPLDNRSQCRAGGRGRWHRNPGRCGDRVRGSRAAFLAPAENPLAFHGQGFPDLHPVEDVEQQA